MEKKNQHQDHLKTAMQGLRAQDKERRDKAAKKPPRTIAKANKPPKLAPRPPRLTHNRGPKPRSDNNSIPTSNIYINNKEVLGNNDSMSCSNVDSNYMVNNNEMNKDETEPIENIDNKALSIEDPLTNQEKRLIELVFSGVSGQKLLQQAGYKDVPENKAELVIQRVMGKLDRHEAGPEILRLAGCGPSALALRIRKLLDHENPRIVLEALKLSAKIQGLLKDIIEGLEAPVIVIGGQDEEQELATIEQGAKPGSEGRVIPMKITK